MKIELSLELINRILAYLGKRPYEEVFQLISEILDAAKPKDKSMAVAKILED